MKVDLYYYYCFFFLSYTSAESARAELATAHKIPPSAKTAAFLKEKAALEYDFYNFIKQRFYEQRTALLGS